MENTLDPFDLQRFLDAQESVYAVALAELRAARKHSHWMWFVFPQLEGLGRSATAARYAIRGLAEARAYLSHPVLGARLQECAAILLETQGRTATGILGSPDDMKLRSSMTLFACADHDPSLWQSVLAKYFNAEPDPRTLALLRAGGAEQAHADPQPGIPGTGDG